MVMNSKIDVVKHPGIMLPPGYERAEDVSAVNSSMPDIDNCGVPLNPQPVFEEKADPIVAEMKTLFERFDETKSDSLGWVQKDEVKIAKARIKEALGFSPLSMCGHYMAVVIYENHYVKSMTGEKSILLSADVKEEKYRRPVGLVVAQGPWCYKGAQFRESIPMRVLRTFFGKWMSPPDNRPWCRVGDWVVLPRHEGQMVNYRGKPMMMIPDCKIYGVVEHPDYVTREF